MIFVCFKNAQGLKLNSKGGKCKRKMINNNHQSDKKYKNHIYQHFYHNVFDFNIAFYFLMNLKNININLYLLKLK